MGTQIGGKQVLMSGSVLLDADEELFVDDGNGTTLRLAWTRDGPNSLTGGTFANLTGELTRQEPSFDHVDQFGVGAAGGGLMKSVRYHVKKIHTGRLVTYTVFLHDQ